MLIHNSFRFSEHLSRLHLILKPFMLRRIKKDVENELSDKIEVMVYCPLTTRQKLLYAGLKQKIRVEDLLAGISGRANPGDDPARSLTSNLMNLVMQFRKVIHPKLYGPISCNRFNSQISSFQFREKQFKRNIFTTCYNVT